jgi:hypothetical protein
MFVCCIQRCRGSGPPPAPLAAASFHAAVWDFLLIIVVAAPLFALTDFVDSCLTVAWRKWLTQHMIRQTAAGGGWADGCGGSWLPGFLTPALAGPAADSARNPTCRLLAPYLP